MSIIRRIIKQSATMPTRSTCLHISRRQTSSSSSDQAYTITYTKNGSPAEVLVGKDVPPVGSLDSDQVLVKMMAATILPSDINLIEGTYGIKSVLPAIPGNEGVGVVESVGDGVRDLKAGDHVVPYKMQIGTWRTHVLSKSADFMKINPKIPFVSAATMTVNPCTALRMLRDFGAQSGDTVIQNGANSAVGQALIQIAKQLGMKTVNVVRDRENLKELADYLYSLGADHVVTDKELRKPETKALWKKITPPKLAIDCVAGTSATELMRHLSRYGVLVNYGGMSKQPITAPVSALIFKEITIRGFWLSEWRNRNPIGVTLSMLEEIGEMMLKQQLRDPLCDLTHIRQFPKAVKNAMTPYINKKQILIMDNSLRDL